MEARTEKSKKLKVINYNDFFYYPEQKKGLEEVIIFPGSELKYRSNIPNSSVWVFNRFGHSYNPSLLGPDVGCGVAGFKIPRLDYEEAADTIAEYLHEKKILGRGNHFVDLCSSIISPHAEYDPNHSIMLIHTDGKEGCQCVPKNMDEARKRVSDAEEFRLELGQQLAETMGMPSYCFGNWTHNSVEICEETIIYRKGIIKIKVDEINLLLASLGREVFFYTAQNGYLPPFNSMPHGTGRKGPLSETKTTDEKVVELRKEIYVPRMISNSSLKSEHPDCYNDYTPIFEKLHHYIIGLGHAEIKAYVGKI